MEVRVACALWYPFVLLCLLTLSRGRSALKPDAIKGDLDSIRSDVKSHYEVRSEATSLVWGSEAANSVRPLSESSGSYTSDLVRLIFNDFARRDNLFKFVTSFLLTVTMSYFINHTAIFQLALLASEAWRRNPARRLRRYQ